MRLFMGLGLLLAVTSVGCGDDTVAMDMSVLDQGVRDSGAVDGATQNLTVMVKDNQFSPAMITIQQGQTVTWTWGNGTNNHHTVTSAKNQADAMTGTADGVYCTAGTGAVCTAKAFAPGSDPGLKNANATFTHTFTTKDTFNYFCIFHFASDKMVGQVIVQ